MIKAIKQETTFKRQDSRSKKQIALTKAFGFAFYGLFLFMKSERNGKIQIGMAVLVVSCGIALQITAHEWIFVLLCIAAVLSLEMLNSAIEKLCDLLYPGYHPTIKVIKDVSAGAVLWAAIISAVIAGIIFLPKIVTLCFPNSHG